MELRLPNDVILKATRDIINGVSCISLSVKTEVFWDVRHCRLLNIPRSFEGARSVERSDTIYHWVIPKITEDLTVQQHRCDEVSLETY
jgi:hypothetical protein